MRILMTSPTLRRRRLLERRWQPCPRLVRLLGPELAAESAAAVLAETNGIGTAAPRQGSPLTLVRSSDTCWLSLADGVVKRLPPDGWRSEAGVFGSATNLVLQSEGLNSATWAKQNGVTAVLDAATPGPLPAVFKCTDPGTGAFGAVTQVISGLTDGQAHTLSFLVKPGTSTGFAIGLRDDTAAVWRGRSDFTVSGGVVVWSATTAGSYLLEKLPLSEWVRVTVKAPTVVAANANRLYCYVTPPSVTQAGDLYLTGVQLQLGAMAQPYIPTTTAASARSADQVTLASGNFRPAFTVGMVTRILDHAGSPMLFHEPGTSGDQNRLDVFVAPAAGLTVALYDDTGAAKTWVQNVSPADRELARWIVSTDNAGAVRAWKNGAAVALTPSGAGTGTRAALNATVQLGRKDLTQFLQGELRAWLRFNRALDSAQVERLQAALRRVES